MGVSVASAASMRVAMPRCGRWCTGWDTGTVRVAVVVHRVCTVPPIMPVSIAYPVPVTVRMPRRCGGAGCGSPRNRRDEAATPATCRVMARQRGRPTDSSHTPVVAQLHGERAPIDVVIRVIARRHVIRATSLYLHCRVSDTVRRRDVQRTTNCARRVICHKVNGESDA